MRFFHWELEFPDVFRQTGAGFDAVLGNPPWETLQPNSMEFFSNIDPLYRSYGKQEAVQRQKTYFTDASVERGWLDYNSSFASASNWTKHAGNPFGDPRRTNKSQDRFAVARGRATGDLHDRWRSARLRAHGFCDPAHPFAHRGEGKAYTYKLFLEAAHALLRPPRPPVDADGTARAQRRGGRFGFLVPSGLYSDHGARPLRELFLGRCRWEWLFGVENRDTVFPIHRSYKFNPVVIEKGGATAAILTAFMRRDIDDWARAEDLATPYTVAQIRQFSPKSLALLEIQSRRDLEILEKIYAGAVLLGDDGPDSWRLRYAQGDFNMTSDSQLFPPRPQWEEKGYQPDEYSRWLCGDWRPIEELWEEMGVDPARPEPSATKLEDWLFDTTAGPKRRQAEVRFAHEHWLKPGDVARTEWRSRCAQPPYDLLPVPRASFPPGVVLSRTGDAWIAEEKIGHIALPLYQGIMIQPFLPSARGWLSGTGLRAKWDYSDLGNLHWNPQYLMAADDARQESGTAAGLKIGYREVARSTDARSFISAIIPSFPCGHKVPILHVGNKVDGQNGYNTIPSITTPAALLNSFVFDWLVRQRLGAAALAWYALAEAALPRVSDVSGLASIVKRLSCFPSLFAPVKATQPNGTRDALHPGERLRLRAMTDAAACATFGLDAADLRHVLRDCDLPTDAVGPRSSAAASLDPRGFWRVDRDKPPELRHTVLTLVAFHDLQAKIDAVDGDREKGIEAFLSQNDGEGWMLPETLRLADYGLGHDERARQPQPAASRLGPRFYDWQLVQSADESWRECHLHARNLLGEHDYALRIVNLIERRMADGEDYLGLLTDRFTRDLLGDGGYVTALVEIRAREILYEGSYWATVTDLRNDGHLDDVSYNQLLDRLHARNLLDDLGHHRRSGRGMPAPAAGLPAQRAAEPRAGYQADLFPKKKQRDLFE